MPEPLKEKWAVFMFSNNVGGQIGAGRESESAAILFFMKTYEVTREEWDRGVLNGKYDCRKVIQ